MSKYEAIIGLEIHVQLKTKTKMFCSCSNDGENQASNTTICPVCLGHPGTLPTPNQEAITLGAKAGLALGCEIQEFSKFDRKNYFYPDLAKGYQISQFDEPIALNGEVKIDVGDSVKTIRINRLHLEEDAAKSFHGKTPGTSLVDYNRGGTPLAEIVTEPDFRTPEEARIFLTELRTLMRYVGASDADMEKGHLRCDANISLRPKGSDTLYPKTEVKNLNSFKSVEKALEYEIERQTELWDEDNAPSHSTTVGWDDTKLQTIEQRGKEASHDYRYFPEPDIPPIIMTSDVVQKLKAELPELPAAKRNRFIAEYGMNVDIINQIISDKPLSNYIEAVISELQTWFLAEFHDKEDKEKLWEKEKPQLIKLVTGWILSKLPALLEKKEKSFEEKNITPENFAEFLILLYKGKLNTSSAQTVLEKMIGTNADPTHIMNESGLDQIDSEAELEGIISEILDKHPEQVQQLKEGKETVLKYLVGQVMKETKGKANPKMASDIIKKIIG